VPLVICVLASALGAAVGTLRGSRRCALALLVLAPVWLLANSPVEIAILWSLNQRHGLTLADLLAIPMVALALPVLWPLIRRSRLGPGPPHRTWPAPNTGPAGMGRTP
jgi:hypothetical protein